MLSAVSLASLSLPPREAWIEIISTEELAHIMQSLPPREAWIEISCAAKVNLLQAVASPAGSVD